MAMDDYVDTLNSWGETILVWADPENKFRGYTEVRHTEQSWAGRYGHCHRTDERRKLNHCIEF